MKNNKGNTPLHDAVIKGCREVACFLLYEDLEVSYIKNKEDKSPLYLAVESCDEEMIASFIEDLEVPYHKNKEDKSPLYLAVESCDGGMIDYFIEAMPEGNLEKLAVGKPDIMLPEDKKGGNLLHVAASMGFLSGARLLNILHVAAGSGQMKIVDEMLRNRDLEALINEKDYDGNTPLHLAAMYCRSEIVQALVSDVRVDKRIVNNEKLKPSGVVVKLLQGGRFEAPNSDGMVCLYAEPFRKTDLVVLINLQLLLNITGDHTPN
ncbi:hypothetical protein NC653_039681 [Populus alba x Populus x berolinensis]|nr:hypothetical protein NC653_039681 [Populus alba x Populus x berolinensis]